MKYLALISLMFIAACQTTGSKPVDISNVNFKNLYALGTFVTYSELCATFSGESADKLKLNALKDKYKGNRQFEKGLGRDGNVFAYDRVQLSDCPRSNAVIEAAYKKNILNSDEVLPNPAPSSSKRELYQLELSWENLLEIEKTYPIYIQNIGRKGYLTSVSLIAGKDCKGIFNYRAKGSGDWTISCKDGTKADGIMIDDSSGKGSSGSGEDSGGNKITFKTYKMAFAK